MITTTPFLPDTEGVWLDLPAEVYHAAPGVSQSTLKAFDEAGTPKHFKAQKPKVPTEDMKFGTVCHTAILQPELLKCAFHLKPDTYDTSVLKCPKCGSETESEKCRKCGINREKVTIQKDWNGGSDTCREWMDTHSNRPIIDKEKESRIPKIVASVKCLQPFATALLCGQREVSFFKRDEETGLLLKCRPDLVATDNGGATWLFDPKKVQPGEATEKAFQFAVVDYGYHIQAASYLHITGASGFVFVPFDDNEPFDCIQWPLSKEFLDLGMLEYRRILRAYAPCVTSDSWPGYRAGLSPLPMPGRSIKRLKELQGL